MPAQKRIEFFNRADSFEEWDTGLSTENPLHMIGYPDKIKALQDKTKLEEVVTEKLASEQMKLLLWSWMGDSLWQVWVKSLVKKLQEV